ncbi:hypothetical protein Tco_1215073 [Tanacetum coccineum]
MLTPHHCSFLCSPLLAGTRKPAAFKPSACAAKKSELNGAVTIQERTNNKDDAIEEDAAIGNPPKLEAPVFGVNEDEHVKEDGSVTIDISTMEKEAKPSAHRMAKKELACNAFDYAIYNENRKLVVCSHDGYIITKQIDDFATDFEKETKEEASAKRHVITGFNERQTEWLRRTTPRLVSDGTVAWGTQSRDFWNGGVTLSAGYGPLFGYRADRKYAGGKIFNETFSGMKGWKDRFFFIDRRAILDVMAWRHHDSNVSDAFQDNDFSIQDVQNTGGNVVTMSEYLRFHFLSGASVVQGVVVLANHPVGQNTTPPLLVGQPIPDKTDSQREKKKISAGAKGVSADSDHVSSPVPLRTVAPANHVIPIYSGNDGEPNILNDGNRSASHSPHGSAPFLNVQMTFEHNSSSLGRQRHMVSAENNTSGPVPQSEGNKEHEKLTTELSQAEIKRFDCIRKLLPTAGWGKGLSEGRTEAQIISALIRVENFDAYSDRKLNPMYDDLFKKEYPYVQKIASGFRHSVADLLKIHHD